MSQHDPHHHGHHHVHFDVSEGPSGASNEGRLKIVLVLTALYMGAEVVGGWWTGSLALLADAGHTLSDVVAVTLTLVAIWIAKRPATVHRTYGHTRAEILAAVVHGLALVGVGTLIISEAIERLRVPPPPILAGGMLLVALGALSVNVIGMWLLSRGRQESLNIRGAWLHLLTDALGSVGVMLAAGAVWAFDWRWADSVASLAIALLVFVSAWGLLRDAIDILMETAPRHLDPEAVRSALLEIEAAIEVHDLHVWTIGNGEVALSSHVVARTEASGDALLAEIGGILRDRFGITHPTIQIERGQLEEACPGGCAAARISAGG